MFTMFSKMQLCGLFIIYQTTYRKALGLAIPLFGNNLKGGARKGSPHHAANLEQKGGLKRNPSHVAYKALNAAGCKKSDAAEIVLMFEKAYQLQGWL